MQADTNVNAGRDAKSVFFSSDNILQVRFYLFPCFQNYFYLFLANQHIQFSKLKTVNQ